MKHSTDNIELFLSHGWPGKPNVSDQALALLIAHAESGKLSYMSCSCLIGTPGAPHALGKCGDYCNDSMHLEVARELPYARAAEHEFCELAHSDPVRRELLLPLLYAERDRRDAIDQMQSSDSETSRELGASMAR